MFDCLAQELLIVATLDVGIDKAIAHHHDWHSGSEGMGLKCLDSFVERIVGRCRCTEAFLNNLDAH